MKLTGDELLECNPEQLFREHPIAEIQNVQKEIQLEIEKKREELRSTVGERYRDLLKAADTIAEMKQTAGTVLSCINDVTVLCKALQEKHLIGFKDQPIDTIRHSWQANEISRVLEIRILLSMPERIWTAIDENQFSLAAELFLLAEQTKLSLQVSRSADKYAIVDSQWNTVAACRQTIIDSALRELKNITLETKDCSDCLTSILLLKPITLSDVLKEYLDLRSEAFVNILQSDENPTVKDKLHAGVLLVQNTLLLVCFCFLDTGNRIGLIEESVSKLTLESAPTTFSKLPKVSHLADEYLSPLHKNFKPSTPKPVKSLSTQEVETELKKWIKKIQNYLQSEMSNLLGLVNNLRGVVAVRKRVSTVNAPSGWNVVEQLLGPLRVYTTLVEPHVAARTLQLVGGVWQDAIASIDSALRSIDEEINKDKKEGSNQSENNIRWFLWKETENDEVALQTRGCTPRVAQVCKSLNEHLQTLLDDVNVYIADVPEKAPLQDYLNACTFETIEKFTKSLNDSKTVKTLCEASIIVRARLLQVLTSQCPNLKKCLRPSDSKIASGRSWSDVVALLFEASTIMWRYWKDSQADKFSSLVKEKLDPDVSVTSFLVSKPACEIVNITEEAEDNNSVMSQLRVPSQPSFNLQELLLQICLRLNAVAVHTLPRIIHLEIIEMVATLVLNHFLQLSASDTIYPSHAWQLLLDVRFITLLLLPRDKQNMSSEVCNRLEGLIDPFDLNVYYQYLQANVNKSAIRLQGTFGLLVDHGEKLAVLNSLKVVTEPQSSSTHEEPNVLAMSCNVPWFPLLPIGNAAARKKEDSPSKLAKQRGKEPKKESTSTDFVKSAGAFFGAMTGGWS